jgi:hypothetical protein
MNIFYLDRDPKTCAEMHNDKHCVKMILEYSQLLSTAHRVLDGKESIQKSLTNRNVKRWVLNDDRDTNLYTATHVNHPSAIWARVSDSNYKWLWSLLVELCSEYTYRYGKVHKCESSGLVGHLSKIPNNIPVGDFTEPTPAMPEEIKLSESLASYRNYYIRSKTHLASWKGKVNGRNVPRWYSEGALNLMTEDAQKLGLGY